MVDGVPPPFKAPYRGNRPCDSTRSMKIPDLTEPVQPPDLSPGQVLASRREEWGLTTQEVAENLNLGVDTIEALEADEYENLPGSTFVKGYMRSYAVC